MAPELRVTGRTRHYQGMGPARLAASWQRPARQFLARRTSARHRLMVDSGDMEQVWSVLRRHGPSNARRFRCT